MKDVVKPLNAVEEALYREGLAGVPPMSNEPQSALSITIREWAYRMRRVFATLDECRGTLDTTALEAEMDTGILTEDPPQTAESGLLRRG